MIVQLLIAVSPLFVSPQEASLAGLKGVHVVVEKLSVEIDPEAILDVELEADVEMLLDESGIKVLRMKEVSSTPGNPYLHFQVRDMKDPNSPLFAISITASLNQRVALERNSDMKGFAQTWMMAGVTTANPESLKQQIRAGTEKLTREFIKSYRAANRK